MNSAQEQMGALHSPQTTTASWLSGPETSTARDSHSTQKNSCMGDEVDMAFPQSTRLEVH
jgi:hypothetical protein